MSHRCIGLMSGTSADGVDAVLAEFDGGRYQRLLGVYHVDYPLSLRQRLIGLGRSETGALTLKEYAELDHAVGASFADAALGLMRTVGITPSDITVIGSHGQTVFHDPRYAQNSLQIGDANVVAARTGIPVAADFRRADLALAGEGAPLVPAFHRHLFGAKEVRTIVNIGGIANVTWLDPSAAVQGYDTGPGNGLMDEWAARVLSRPFDADGALAAAGVVKDNLLKAWLADPYFHTAAPKSTGRAKFNLDWAAQRGGMKLEKLDKADVMATFCELTAQSIADNVAPKTQRLLVCGGGARNRYLMERLQTLLPAAEVAATNAYGLPAEWVEAAAFAWLALMRWQGLPANMPSVTGARGPAVLGGLYLPGA